MCALRGRVRGGTVAIQKICTLPNGFTMFYTYSHLPSCAHACS